MQLLNLQAKFRNGSTEKTVAITSTTGHQYNISFTLLTKQFLLILLHE